MNLLESPGGRRLLFTVLYASEGAPIGFLWWALPTLLRGRGFEIGPITSLLAILVLPWTFKFLWAPLIDSRRGRAHGLRPWIAGSQAAMGLALVPVAFWTPDAGLVWLGVFLIAHALFASTQDVAIDALAIRTVPVEERGRLNGFMQAGMLTGRSVFGGGALAAAETFGWSAVFWGLLGVIWVSLGLLIFVREPAPSADPGPEHGFTRTLRAAFTRRSTLLGLAFALVSAAGFEATGALAGPFLTDMGVSAGQIGLFLGIPVVAAMAVGGLWGGRLSDRRDRIGVLAVALVGFVTAVGLLAGAAAAGFGGIPVLFTLLGLMYFFVGLFVAVSYALFMDLTDPALGATQFSTFMAATNGCEAWSTWAGGRLVAGPGYPAAFAVMAGVSLLGLPLLARLRRVATSRSGA